MQPDDFLDHWELEAWQRYQTELALISRVAEMRTVSRRDINDLGHLAARAAIQESVAPLASAPSEDPITPSTPPPLPNGNGQWVPGQDQDDFDKWVADAKQRAPRGVGA